MTMMTMRITTVTSYLKQVFYVAWLALLGAGFSWHLRKLHENSVFFSHLSSIERELTFRSELGLYYSYYKDLIGSESLCDGIAALLADNNTEYPDSVNVLRRFNLYPEVFLAATYRTLMHYAKRFEIQTKECYAVSREDLPPVHSCIGWGDPAEFYVRAVFLWNGVLLPALFQLSATLSGSLLGGVLCVAAFAFNNEEATRVQWGAQLRESFAYPFFVFQLLTFTRFLLSDRSTSCLESCGETKAAAKRSAFNFRFHFPIFTFLTAAFLTTWQFAQFVCATQLAIGVALRIARFFDAHVYAFLVRAHATAFLFSFVLLFANRMLVTSLYFAVIVAAMALHLLDFASRDQRPDTARPRTALIRIGICLVSFVLCKWTVSQVVEAEDDGHIWEILRSKLDPSYRTFDSQLYTCADVFDWINFGAVLAISKTLLLPCAALAALYITFYCLVHAFRVWVPPTPRRSSLRPAKPQTAEETSSSSEISSQQSLRKRNVPHTNVDQAPRSEAEHDHTAMSSAPTRGDVCECEQDSTWDAYSAAFGYHLLQLLVFMVLAVLVMRLKLLCVPLLCVFAGLLASPRLVHVCFVLPMRSDAAQSTLRGALFVVLLIGMALQGVANLRAQHAVQAEFNDAATEAALSWIATNTLPNAAFAGSMPISATIKLTLGRPIVCHPHYEDAGLRRRVRAVYSLVSRKPLAEVHRALRRYGVDFVVLEKRWCLGSARREGCTQPEIWDLDDVANRGRQPVCNRLQERAERDIREIDAYFVERYRSDDYLVLELRDRSKSKGAGEAK